MNKTIEAALKNQKEAYSNNVEKAFDVVEQKIITSSKEGASSTLIAFDDLLSVDVSLKYIITHNSNRFIDDLADHLEIGKDLIKRVYSPKSPNNNLITGIYISWGESDVK
ncbi:hypothetical protein [Macrococcoides caseolyticum]|uniref:hypothetical protein n=1 Tax=Macrococcoides caseolyticum TaxID=69966 RepID=UPI000C33C5AE|nr:hypothetical protein [Macrococcus caseolyticus]PKE22498.1 hypothetical protein CW688_02140 [Macrococcus caseolyticus]